MRETVIMMVFAGHESGGGLMNILGINYYFHDSAACIIADGQVIVAIEEERLTRDKHTRAFPSNAISRCLEIANLAPADIDGIAVSIKPAKNWAAKVGYGLARLSRASTFVAFEARNALINQRRLRSWYEHTWPSGGPDIHYVPHHAAHAVGSFLASPYDHAAILSLDGAGEWATSFIGEGRGTQVTGFSESFFPDSLGAFYEAATQFCGFRPNYDEGKTMGLAPFGDSSVYYEQVRRLVSVDENGRIHIDLEPFDYQFWGDHRYSRRFVEMFGEPRTGTEFADNHYNVAAAFQVVLEECALEMCSVLRTRTNAPHLVIAGGVALNSVMNGRIVAESDFDDIYVMPAAGDNGTAIGAALYAYHVLLGNPRTVVHDTPYVGTEYSDEQIGKLIAESKLVAEKRDDIVDATARLLADGQIVGWFQGRMEIGPRALGNRSILANPTLPHMKDKVNAEVKHREAFRPFAPSVQAEATGKYFDVIGESPFMLKVCPVKSEMCEVLPAITHVDGSARLHTVTAEANPLFHELLGKFGELTSVPVLLNSSFNVMGEPIVESPAQALRCFASTGLDALAMGNYLIRKSAITSAGTL
jgi:carbamoyltransferase